MTVRRRGAIAVLALAALTLAGCTFAPDRDAAEAEARAVFDDVVAALGETDPAVLRTVEAAPETEQPCGEDEDGTQVARTATATLSVAADPAAIDDTMATLAGILDPAEWDRIHPARDAPGQQAWASQNGVVMTITFADPVLVTAVFTPCLT